MKHDDIEKFLKQTLIQMELGEDSYLHSFVREDGFKGRRFTRYVEKVKNGLFSFVKNYTTNFEFIYNHGSHKTNDILDYFYANLIIYTQFVNDKMEHLRPILFLFQLPEVPSIILDGNEELIDDTLAQTPIIYPIIEQEIESACLEHLAYLVGVNKEINEVNYVRETLPFSPTDNLKLLNDIFFRLLVCLEHLIMINHDYTTELGEEVRNVHKEMEETENYAVGLEKEIMEKNILIKKLKKQVEEEREKYRNLANKNTEELRKENYELIREK